MTGTASRSDVIGGAIELGAEELQFLQLRLRSIERQLEGIFSRRPADLTTEEIASLQDIDHIVQSLDALKDYFFGLSDETVEPLDSRIRNAIDAIPIGALRDRLRGVQERQVNRGQPELF